ncbi:MAG: four helix bundle suffix domain-containing protein [Bacteroidaceae bacterium]|nr:four helix bundle suffix domain-containing protein [Bacteroidaceae bacterium]
MWRVPALESCAKTTRTSCRRASCRNGILPTSVSNRCRTSQKNNQLADYEPYFQQWTAEEMANVALTMCYQVDTMMNKYLKKVEEIFVKEGGVKERMHKARTEYRKQQDERLAELERRLPQLEQQLSAAQAEANQWKAAYDDLKQRALKAYYQQQEEIKALKQRLGL